MLLRPPVPVEPDLRLVPLVHGVGVEQKVVVADLVLSQSLSQLLLPPAPVEPDLRLTLFTGVQASATVAIDTTGLLVLLPVMLATLTGGPAAAGAAGPRDRQRVCA